MTFKPHNDDKPRKIMEEISLSALRAKGAVPLTAKDEQAYDVHYTEFAHKLHLLAKLEPRSDYLYPLMRTVAFCDAKSAIDAGLESYKRVLKR